MEEEAPVKRLIIAVALVLSALAATNGHASAAGLPPLLQLKLQSTPNDYAFIAESCTGSGSVETCGVLYAFNDSTANIGTPTGELFGCVQESPTLYKEGVVFLGNYGVGEGVVSTQTAGVAGVLSSSAIYSNLVGKSTINSGPFVGTTSGSAVGVVKFNPEEGGSGPVTSGKISINVRGALLDEYSETTSQGSMSCSISNTGASIVEVGSTP